MPVAHLPHSPVRRARLRALGAGATVAALVLVACSPSKDEAPEPLTIDVVGGTFPDAREAGVLDVIGDPLDSGYSTTLLDDGSFLVAGSSDGEVDDSVGVLDPATGEVDWVVTADVAEGSAVVPGDLTERWVTWSVETDEGVTPEDAVPFVFALDRTTQKTYVLADGRSDGGFAPGTNGGRVFVVGDLAVWEGAVPVEDEDGPEDEAGSDGAGGATGEDDAADDAEVLLDDEDLGDEDFDDEDLGDEDLGDEDVPVEDALPVSTAVFARSLDASAGVLTVAPEAGGLVRDDCVEGAPVTVQVFAAEDVERRTVTAEGTLGASLADVARAEGEDVWLQCGGGGVVETLAEDGSVLVKAVVRGEGRDIVLVSDGVADLQVVGLVKDWAVVWVGDLETGLGRQLLVHRPTGKVFSLGDSESGLLVLRAGVVAFGGPADAAELSEEDLGDEDLGDEDLGDEEPAEEDLGDEVSEGGAGGRDEAAGSSTDDVEVIDGDVEVVEDDELLGDDDIEIVEDDELTDDGDVEDGFEDDFGGGTLTTVARLVAPQA